MIVYYLGAGASFGTFPIYSEMRGKIISSLVNIKNNHDSEKIDSYLGLSKHKTSRISTFFKEIEDLHTKLEEYETIDSYFHDAQFNGKLIDLKKIFSALMYYWHLTNKPNKRYQAMLAKFIKPDRTKMMRLVEPLTIISWNYDLEIERSISRTLGISLLEVERFINRDPYNFDSEKINLFKLNGSFMSINEQHQRLLTNNLDPQNKAITYFLMLENIEHDFVFAWEDINATLITKALNEIVNDAKALVCIGYSFPEFNKDIDDKILKDYRGKFVLQCTDDEAILNSTTKFKEKRKSIQILNWESNMVNKNYIVDGNLDSFHIPIVRESRIISQI